MKINFGLMAFGLLLFNFPILGIFQKTSHVLYVPVLIAALFLFWGGFIGLLYLTFGREKK